MKDKQKSIIEDLINIDPSLKDKKQNLERIIQELLEAKPTVKMSKGYVNKLKKDLVDKFPQKKTPERPFAFLFRKKWVLSAAAAVIIILIAVPLIYLGLDRNKAESEIRVYSTETPVKEDSLPVDIDNDIIQTPYDESEIIDSKTTMDKEELQGTDYSPEGPPGGEGGTTPQYKDLSRSRDRYSGEEEESEHIVVQSKPLEQEPTIESYPKSAEKRKTETVQMGVRSGDVEDDTWLFEDTESVTVTDGIAGQDMDQKDTKYNTEEYERIYENPFLATIKNSLSTFSIDVDTASYANVRRFINSGSLPYKDAVRIEELINYFTYDYPEPTGEEPFSFNTEISSCPWNNDHQLLNIGLQARKVSLEALPPNNIVFLLDVSGSMDDDKKLPLLKSAFKLLVNELRPMDKVAIVVYAGAAGVVLDSTPGSEKDKIIAALDRLQAGGSTAGGQGIVLAYELAKQNFNAQANNRVILATDGDFNVGVSSNSELERMIEEKRKQGIFLTVLGFGMGNYKDSKMELLADKGNGNYAYIDNLLEAKKVLVSEMGATLFTIAKDVKIQIEFNPAKVESYRLIGYENRVMRAEDFDDDTKDAGELGAGHTVTALYELVPVSGAVAEQDLQYQTTTVKDEAYSNQELATIKFRYKKPSQEQSILLTHPIIDQQVDLDYTSDNYRFSAAVAEWGLLLRESEYKGTASYEQVLSLAQNALADDASGYRREFVELVKITAILDQ